MSAVEQLDYVERYYEIIIKAVGPITTLEDHYLAVLSPSCVGKSPDAVMPCTTKQPLWIEPEDGCKDFSSPYCANDGLDIDKDKVITTHEATTPVRRIIREAELKAPIVVDMEKHPTSFGTISVVGLAALGFWLFKKRLP
jgi:hypothetical protein